MPIRDEMPAAWRATIRLDRLPWESDSPVGYAVLAETSCAFGVKMDGYAPVC